MKKMFACVLALCPMIASADYLDDKIASLTKEKLDKIAKLEECQKSTKGLKIAGITTLGVSAIGIGANIGEAVKLNKLDTQIGAAETTKSNLDRQISAAEEEKAKKEKAAEAEQERQRQATNNTCGTKTCDAAAPTQDGLDLLNATEAVCKDGNWVAKKCKEGYSGTEQTCTLNGEKVTYIDSCRSAAPTEKQCQSVTEDWKTQNHVKTTACDKTTGENYITECADTYTGETDENGRITECKIKEQAQPAVSDRAHHSACKEAEKIDLQSKGADKVWVYNNKCVPKSCKTGWYLVVKDNASQGYCVKTCPDYQQKSWANGGQACDKLKSETLDSQTNQSGNSALQTVPVVQQNDSTTVVVQEVVQPIENKLPGRDMGGAAIYYKQAVKGQDIHPYVEIDGKKYQGYATAGVYSTRPSRALADLRKKLEDAGYSNFNLVAGN